MKNVENSYWSIVKKQFSKNRPAVWSLRFIAVIFFLGFVADFLANEKPIYCKYKGESIFPIFKQYGVDLGLHKWPANFVNVSWKDLEYESVIWPLVPYSPQNLDFANRDYKSPFDEQNIKSSKWRHHFGTDKLGRDVLAGMLHGTRVAMLVGIISMTIAAFIGILIGSLAGYYGDTRMKASRIRIILFIISLPVAWFYGFGVRNFIISESFESSGGAFISQLGLSLIIFAGVITAFMIVGHLLKKIPALGKQLFIPVDILVSRFIEIFVSIPLLLLILSIVAILPSPSLYYVMIIIGFTSWTGIARLIRGELLKVRSLEYIEAAQALGYSEGRIIFRHAIPNALTSVLIAVAFGVASAILTESSLSFLGIGVKPEQVTWGSMLSAARGFPEAWWLAIFPGLAIFLTVTVFNLLGEGLTDALDPRLKK